MNRFVIPSDRFRLRVVRVRSVISVAALMLSVLAMVGGSARPALAAPILRGEVGFGAVGGVPVTSGGSGPFNITLPTGAACQGGGAAGYRWETYLVSASVDVGALTFGSGPNPVTGALVVALFDTFGEQVSQKVPAPSPLGLISGIPQTSLDATINNTAGSLPVGSYKIGIACTFNSGAEVQDYWMTAIDVTANPADTPLGIAWTIAAPPPPPVTGLAASQIAGPGVHLSWTAPTGTAPTNYTIGVAPTVTGAPFTAPAGSTTFDITGLVANTAYTLSVTANYATAPLTGPAATVAFTFVPATTTTVVGTTTTVVGTTTTVVGATSTTSASSTTTTSVGGTTTTGPASGTTTTRPTSPATPIQVGAPNPSAVGTLAETGSSPYPYVIWGILLLVLGRIAILLRRPLRVRPHSK